MMFQHSTNAQITVETISVGCNCSHSCNTCITPSSDLKDLLPSTSVSGPIIRKSLSGSPVSYTHLDVYKRQT